MGENSGNIRLVKSNTILMENYCIKSSIKVFNRLSKYIKLIERLKLNSN